MVIDIFLNGLDVLESFDHEGITNDCGYFKENYRCCNPIQLPWFQHLLSCVRLVKVADHMKHDFFSEPGCWQTGPIIDFFTLVKLIGSGDITILCDLAETIVEHVDEVLEAKHGIASALLRYYRQYSWIDFPH